MTAEQTALKMALETYGRTIDLEIESDSRVYTSAEIVSCTPSFEGSILTAIMQAAEIELDKVGGPEEAEALKGKRLYITLTVNGEETGQKEFGTFIVKDAKYNDESGSITLETYDLMLLSMTEYTSVVEFPSESNPDATPVTLGAYLQAICDFLGIELATPEFVNSGVIIDEEKYNKEYTFRDVLTEIAQAAGGTIAIKNDKLWVLYPTATETIVEPSNLKSIKIGEIYGPVNSIVLARTPQEDIIFKKDETAENICEIKIENNQLMDSHREDFIEGIYNALYGLTYYPHEVESYGIGVLEICDLFTIETLDGKTYTALYISGDTEINQGLIERTKGAIPKVTETDYKAASQTDRTLNKTILRVDKQEGLIQGLITKTENIPDDITGELAKITKSVETTMSAEDIKILVSTSVEGKNSITTSMGYTFDDNGLLIERSDAEVKNKLDHTGMYVDQIKGDNVLTANNKGVDALNLKARKFLIVGENSRLEDYEGDRTACFYIGG